MNYTTHNFPPILPLTGLCRSFLYPQWYSDFIYLSLTLQPLRPLEIIHVRLPRRLLLAPVFRQEPGTGIWLARNLNLIPGS